MIEKFNKLSKENHRIFIQDRNDTSVANGVINYFETYYTLDLLNQCLDEYFVKRREAYVTIADFCIKFGDIARKIHRRNEGKEDFDNLVKETRKRMEELGEL